MDHPVQDETFRSTAGDGRDGDPAAARRRRLALLARASVDEMAAALAAIAPDAAVTPLRGPEIGLIMLRGRMGGSGGAFNLGEATVARATVRLAGGSIGHALRLGTDRTAARLAAVLDALGEDTATAAEVAGFCDGIAARLDGERRVRARETAATRVDFFTMVRGED